MTKLSNLFNFIFAIYIMMLIAFVWIGISRGSFGFIILSIVLITMVFLIFDSLDRFLCYTIKSLTKESN